MQVNNKLIYFLIDNLSDLKGMVPIPNLGTQNLKSSVDKFLPKRLKLQTILTKLYFHFLSLS